MTVSTGRTLPLQGIRVIDFSRVLAGPVCGAMLGDLGADVIKVEDAEGGDESRSWAPQREGESGCYIANNRNKRGVALDLKSVEGAAIARDLIRSADVVIENFRTGTMESFGLGYDTLSGLNSRLVYCSVSAFGRTGPRAQEAGYEALMQAFAGIMSITGEANSPPVRCGVSVLDIMTGTLCAFGILAAIMQRETTGCGQRVDGSLLDTAVGLLNFQAQNHLLTGVVPRPYGSAHPSLVPYKNFPCRDGSWVFIAGGNDRLWQRLARSIGLAELAHDSRFATNVDRVSNRDELEAEIARCTAAHDRDALLSMLADAGVPATPVNTVDQVLRDPQMASRPAVKKMEHPKLGSLEVVGLPLAFSSMQAEIVRHAPAHGEHTGDVLKELGYSEARISELREKKVLA